MSLASCAQKDQDTGSCYNMSHIGSNAAQAPDGLDQPGTTREAYSSRRYASAGSGNENTVRGMKGVHRRGSALRFLPPDPPTPGFRGRHHHVGLSIYIMLRPYPPPTLACIHHGSGQRFCDWVSRHFRTYLPCIPIHTTLATAAATCGKMAYTACDDASHPPGSTFSQSESSADFLCRCALDCRGLL